MKKNPRLLSFLCICSLLLLWTGCAERRSKPVDPDEPGVKRPPVTKPDEPKEPSTPEPPSPQPPAPTPRPTPPPPPAPKPRQPAKGDTASLKLVDNGVKLLNAGDLDSAEQMFEQALRVSPTNGKPYYYLGVVAAKQKNYDRSLGFLGQAETYLKDDDFWMSQVFLQEGLSLKAQGKNAEARAKLQEALKRDPNNQWAQAELSKLK